MQQACVIKERGKGQRIPRGLSFRSACLALATSLSRSMSESVISSSFLFSSSTSIQFISQHDTKNDINSIKIHQVFEIHLSWSTVTLAIRSENLGVLAAISFPFRSSIAIKLKGN
jgi:hypothetical protein